MVVPQSIQTKPCATRRWRRKQLPRHSIIAAMLAKELLSIQSPFLEYFRTISICWVIDDFILSSSQDLITHIDIDSRRSRFKDHRDSFASGGQSAQLMESFDSFLVSKTTTARTSKLPMMRASLAGR